MRILVATDAWRPQVNGVVRSLEQTAKAAQEHGVEFVFLSPNGFASLPLPSYGEIRLALATPGQIARQIDAAGADFIHIATEGPIGFFTRQACLRRGRIFTTSYHTRFPEYISARVPLPESWSYAALRRFHNAGAGTMVSTPSFERELAGRGFQRLMRWSRGVDHTLFRPRAERIFDLPGPIFLYVGRVAVEKNIEAFLRLDLPGTKLVVGDGPSLKGLKAAYPAVTFLGARHGEELARLFASADVFVFPSRTDTFGLVLLEALASGTPVAAYPVTGPIDVIGKAPVGVLHEDLRTAALKALDIPREASRAYAEQFSWARSTEQFLAHLPVISP